MAKRHRKAQTQKPVVVDLHPKPKISYSALAAAQSKPAPAVSSWAIPSPAPGVAPDKARMAMDDACSGLYNYAINSYRGFSPYAEGLAFPGYPLLAELAQRAENRRMVSVVAQEMTRRWCRLTSSSENDNGKRIKDLDAAMKRFRVQDIFREAAELDGFYGIGHIFPDFNITDPNELRVPLMIRPEKIKKGSLKRFRTIEPMWCYPGQYDATNPLSPDFYRPKVWYVMAQEVNSTRLLSIVSREVADILKPAFMFGGVSLLQIAHPSVENWLRVRKSVSDLLHSFTVWQLKTSMQSTLAGSGGEEMLARADLFNRFRDNRGLMLIDKETEELDNVSAPLGGLDALQGQAQQQMAAICGIPLTKLLGTPPTGLNASSDGEIKSFYDTIAAQQRHLFDVPLKKIMDIIQLSEFGDIDDTISFEWESLEDPNEAERASVRKTDIDAAVELINAGVLHPEEERARLAGSEESLYHGIDVDDIPEPPEEAENPHLLGDPAKSERGSEV